MRNLQWLRKEQLVPLPLASVFPFFSNAENLEELTPPWVGFRILSPLPIEMREGTLIDYEIRLHRIPLRWRTKITVWQPPYRFVDEQLVGPYSRWRHEHTFEEFNGQTIVRDDILYRIPFSWMPGTGLIQKYLVHPELERIFSYRQQALLRHFNLPDSTPTP